MSTPLYMRLPDELDTKLRHHVANLGLSDRQTYIKRLLAAALEGTK